MAVTLDLLKRLIEHQVEFVLVGGLAAVLHGSRRITEDIDVCIPFTTQNLSKVLSAIADLKPRYRMRPDLPTISSDPAHFEGWKNLYLITNFGQLDLLGEIGGVGGYEEALENSEELEVAGKKLRVLSLAALI